MPFLKEDSGQIYTRERKQKPRNIIVPRQSSSFAGISCTFIAQSFCTHRCSLSSHGVPAACSCHPLGSAALPLGPRTFCDPSTGDCPCKPGVAGPRCDHCLPGYWGFGAYGCRPCDCARSCDPYTGDCRSSRWVGGPGHPLPASPHPCSLHSREGTVPTLYTYGTWAEKYPLYKIFGVWYGQDLGIEQDQRLEFTWVPGTPW